MPLPQHQEQYILKLSTRNHPNFSANVADKRFEALVKKEMMEHQHIISSHHKEMQALRDELNLAMQRCKSIAERNEKDLEELKAQTNYSINILKDRLKADEAIIIEQRKTIEGLNQQILAIYMGYATKNDVDKLKSSHATEIKANTISHLNAFQDFQREFKILLHVLKSDIVKLNLEVEQKCNRLSERGEKNFSVAQIDKDSVLKEVRVYQKDIFVIEKKIENIYTLIERINKRGDTCHRQE